ncbi:hypothetical protein H7827_06395 [Streptomyces sp. JH002]|jgi:predicted nucleic acid-binding protein|uniref:Membrane protein n=1 Tax=Streptomyces xiamenensis TaxID=408015 RepID=A0A0F7FYR9_9ACTN|nr:MULTISPECIES: hypothetical protein [Streptomyces]AKG45704.1 membrane protein [Streptomyces xiamenensis]MCU4749425.1 hypothetical protein [Streptomyces sp. G-5]QQN77048.1 hypothetical protein IPZ77_06015 [Streptomyces sp. XC 2026]
MSKKTKSKASTYLSIGTTLFGAIGVVKQLRTAREERDALELADAVISAAAIVTGLALLSREVRRINREAELALPEPTDRV